MFNKLKTKTISLALAGTILVGAVSAGSALAYFTTYTDAKGGVQLSLSATETEIEETVIDGEKQVVIQNTSEADCYVRVKAFAGDKYEFTYVDGGTGDWTPGADGYWYYTPVLPAGSDSSMLKIQITLPAPERDNESGDVIEAPADFNVIVVQECTPVLYDKDGKAYADWNNIVKSDQEVAE